MQIEYKNKDRKPTIISHEANIHMQAIVLSACYILVPVTILPPAGQFKCTFIIDTAEL